MKTYKPDKNVSYDNIKEYQKVAKRKQFILHSFDVTYNAIKTFDSFAVKKDFELKLFQF